MTAGSNALTVGVDRAQSAPDHRVAARHHLMDSCQGLVRNIAWKIHRKLPPAVDLDDLIAYGQVGLAQAAAAYDSSRGGQFTTYAYYRIRGSIMDGLGQMAWFCKAKFYGSKYEEMSGDVFEVDAAQSADSTRQTAVEEVNWFAQLTASLSVVYLSSNSDEGAQDLSNQPTPGLSPMTHAMDGEIKEKLWRLVDALPGEAGTLIRATYCEGLSQTEIAQRLGISKAWVSRLHTKTLQRLARSLRLMAVEM